jgi:two-component system, OmpR family, response regulator ChvI
MERGRQPRILVVDDEPDITLVIKGGLEDLGYLVDAFNDPEDALSSFKPGHYDMLILDIRMPRLTGFQLYREIRKKDDKAKVCFMTAFDVHKEEFAKIFPSYDVKSFIKKPIRVKDLLRLVQSEMKDI